MKNKNVAIALIAGVSIGAVAALLLSPDKGSATRKKIAEKFMDLGSSMKDYLMGMVHREEEPASSGMRVNTMG